MPQGPRPSQQRSPISTADSTAMPGLFAESQSRVFGYRRCVGRSCPDLQRRCARQVVSIGNDLTRCLPCDPDSFELLPAVGGRRRSFRSHRGCVPPGGGFHVLGNQQRHAERLSIVRVAAFPPPGCWPRLELVGPRGAGSRARQACLTRSDCFQRGARLVGQIESLTSGGPRGESCSRSRAASAV